jgi:hypothetical protein
MDINTNINWELDSTHHKLGWGSVKGVYIVNRVKFITARGILYFYKNIIFEIKNSNKHIEELEFEILNMAKTYLKNDSFNIIN